MTWWRAIVRRLRGGNGPKSIVAAKREVESGLLAMPGVVSVGIGRADDGTEVIIVGVDGSRPDVEPQLPRTASGFSVEVHRIGPLRAT